MIKVLYVNGGIMRRGGIESFMMNYFRRINSEEIHIDFIVHGNEPGDYDREIMEAGSIIYRLPKKSKHPITYQKRFLEILNNNHYDIIHTQMDAMNGVALRLAKKSKIPTRISHSHNTSCLSNNRIKIFINNCSKSMIPKYATHFFACSDAAGRWLYGKDEEFTIINNAIDLGKFLYREDVRAEVRKGLNIDDKFVIGHVGRFDYQKNHEFIVSIVEELVKHKKNVIVLLIGDGDMEDQIRDLIKEKNLQDYFVFLGSRADVERFYNAMDVFILPSRFEGLPIVGIEAQANGLPCLFSLNITPEICMTKNAKMVPLNKEKWIEALLNNPKRSISDAADSIRKRGYDINFEAEQLKKLYLSV